jgi:hypothetical protein
MWDSTSSGTLMNLVQFGFKKHTVSKRFLRWQMKHSLIDISTRDTKIANALQSNPSCRNGMLTHTQVFTTPSGPSLGPEMLVMILADEQWGDMFWYGHVMSQPGTDRFVATIFRSNKFINGMTTELLFKRLFHWTVVDPQIKAPQSKADGDCFGNYPTFDAAVDGLCHMIASFDEQDQMICSSNTKGNGTEDARMIDFYEQWGDYIEFCDAYPIPPTERPKPATRAGSPQTHNIAKIA